MTIQDLTAKVKQLKELEAFADEIQAELDTVKDEIKTYMEQQSREEMTVDVFKVRYVSIMSKRFDTTAFKSTHTELYQSIQQADGNAQIFSSVTKKSNGAALNKLNLYDNTRIVSINSIYSIRLPLKYERKRRIKTC